MKVVVVVVVLVGVGAVMVVPGPAVVFVVQEYTVKVLDRCQHLPRR